jgi:penicillin-binding protein 1C
VSARAALSSSLNAPAVRVLRMVGYPAAKSWLNLFGFGHIDREASYYTDSLILGGCEVTLTELAAAYRALANGGVYAPLRWAETSAEFSKQVISPEAAFLVTNVLQDERRLIPLYQELFQERNQMVAFKTGTSYGLRDAWCIGYSKNYTVGIWVGSAPGAGDSSLVGMQAAAPLMLKVTSDIWDNTEALFERPKGVYSRSVCALSGALPTNNCPRTINDFAIKGVTKMTLCSLHKNIDGRGVIAWPPELRNWMPLNDGTSSIKSNKNNIKITRPVSGHTVMLQNNAASERIFLSAEGDAPHYWYLDGKFIGVSQNGEGLFFDVSRGAHKASVMSGESSDSVSFAVRTPKEIGSIDKVRRNILN